MSSLPPDDDKTLITPHESGHEPIRPAEGKPGSRPASSAGSSGNALPVGTRLAEFELTGVIGEGGFGIVYLAWDHSLQRRVALKEYMPAALASRVNAQVLVRSARHGETFAAGLRSFINEARLLARFDHPALVKVYRFWEANDTAYMVMPLYEGITLKDYLKQVSQRPDEAWLRALLAPLTEALQVLHTEHCYHRDIAPDNIILLAGSGKPLLLDFGAARRVIGDMTQALTVILKPGFAPIEQYADAPNMKQGPWTDIYALAATVHCAMTGRTPPASVSRVVSDQFVPLARTAAGRYSAAFLVAIDKALKVRPEERTQSIAELRADLGFEPAALPDTTPTQGPTRTVAPAPPPAAAVPAEAAPAPGHSTDPGPASAPPAGTAPAGRHGVGFGLGVAALVLALSSIGGYLALASNKGGARAGAGTAAATPASVPTGAGASHTRGAGTVARGFDVGDEFDKVIAGQTAGFSVTAAAAKPQLRIGRDTLAFSVHSVHDGFVQVLLLGPDGSLMLLFPNAQASDNRIKAGQTLRLPQASWPLVTSEPAGPEHFLVIVSTEPRDYSELSQERDYIFLKLPTQQRGTALAASWTRSTPLLLGGLRNCSTADCDAYGAARFSIDVVH